MGGSSVRHNRPNSNELRNKPLRARNPSKLHRRALGIQTNSYRLTRGMKSPSDQPWGIRKKVPR